MCQALSWARGSVSNKADSIWGKGTVPGWLSYQEGLYPTPPPGNLGPWAVIQSLGLPSSLAQMHVTMADWPPSPTPNTERSMGSRARGPNGLSTGSANSQQATCVPASDGEPGRCLPPDLV